MKNSGFTLIEILLVVTIGVVLSTAGFLSYNEYKNRRDLELSLQELSAAVEDVQQRSVTQEDGNRWSIRLTASSTGEDVYQIYTGDTYSTSSVEQSYSFSRPVYFSEPSGDRSVDLNFTPVNGGIDTKKIITISHRNADFRAGDIIVSSLGLVTNRMHDNISAYWHFEEGSGNETVDASGQGNDGEVSGASWVGSSNCVVGQCLEFDGTDDYVDAGSSSELNPLSEITITAWIKGDSFAGAGTNSVVTKWNQGSDWSYILRVRDGSMRYQIQNESGGSVAVSGSSPSTDTWHHVALVYDGSQVIGYFDGIEDGAQSLSGAIKDVNIETIIGARNSDGVQSNFFDGQIDEVRIYNTALSSSTIRSHYNDLR